MGIVEKRSVTRHDSASHGRKEEAMRFRAGFTSWAPVLLCLALASCTLARQAIVRNASGSDLLLWPLGERPVPLKAGTSTEPIVLYAHERHEAMVQRGDCLFTYPAPDYFALPKAVRDYKPVTFVIGADMRLSLHLRSKDGVDGPAIETAGFPLTPTSFCGRAGAAGTPSAAR
jgi:hypothetical protein